MGVDRIKHPRFGKCFSYGWGAYRVNYIGRLVSLWNSSCGENPCACSENPCACREGCPTIVKKLFSWLRSMEVNEKE